MNKFITLKEDSSGECFIDLPKEFLDSLGWNEKTILILSENEDGYLKLERKTTWTVEELQDGDNLENVIDDVSVNKVLHYIIDANHKFVIHPYIEDEYNLIKEIKNEN